MLVTIRNCRQPTAVCLTELPSPAWRRSWNAARWLLARISSRRLLWPGLRSALHLLGRLNRSLPLLGCLNRLRSGGGSLRLPGLTDAFGLLNARRLVRPFYGCSARVGLRLGRGLIGTCHIAMLATILGFCGALSSSAGCGRALLLRVEDRRAALFGLRRAGLPGLQLLQAGCAGAFRERQRPAVGRRSDRRAGLQGGLGRQ